MKKYANNIIGKAVTPLLSRDIYPGTFYDYNIIHENTLMAARATKKPPSPAAALGSAVEGEVGGTEAGVVGAFGAGVGFVTGARLGAWDGFSTSSSHPHGSWTIS
jgi:hypothetical protein